MRLIKKNNKNIKKDDINVRKQKLKIYKSIMVIFDILALILLIYQIYNKEVTISSYIVLILCNIIVFMSKVEE